MSRRKKAVKRPVPPDRALRQPDRLEVHQRPDVSGQEGDGRAHLLRRDGHRRGAHEPARRERLQAGAHQPQAGRRGEEPPRRWRDVPGAGRSPSRSPHRAGHALAHLLLARPQREVDGREARRRSDRSRRRARATRSRRRKTPTAWPTRTRRSRTIAGSRRAKSGEEGRGCRPASPPFVHRGPQPSWRNPSVARRVAPPWSSGSPARECSPSVRRRRDSDRERGRRSPAISSRCARTASSR